MSGAMACSSDFAILQFFLACGILSQMIFQETDMLRWQGRYYTQQIQKNPDMYFCSGAYFQGEGA